MNNKFKDNNRFASLIEEKPVYKNVDNKNDRRNNQTKIEKSENNDYLSISPESFDRIGYIRNDEGAKVAKKMKKEKKKTVEINDK